MRREKRRAFNGVHEMMRLREEDDEVTRGTVIERRVSSCRGPVGYKLPVEHDDETLKERKRLDNSKEKDIRQRTVLYRNTAAISQHRRIIDMNKG